MGACGWASFLIMNVRSTFTAKEEWWTCVDSVLVPNSLINGHNIACNIETNHRPSQCFRCEQHIALGAAITFSCNKEGRSPRWRVDAIKRKLFWLF